MELKPWSMDSFGTLVHRDRWRTGPGEFLYFEDVVNLRLDADGNLITRQGHTIEYQDHDDILGIAAVEVNGINYIFWTTDDNYLVMTEYGGASTDLIQGTDANFRGRLSAVAIPDLNIAVVTSEGNDTGYWVDLANAEAHSLSLQQAVASDVTLTSSAGGGSVGATQFYYYKFVYTRKFITGDDNYQGEWTSTAWSQGNIVKPTVSNGYLYECTTAGTSGVTEPTWPTTLSVTVNDGTAVWTCRGREFGANDPMNGWRANSEVVQEYVDAGHDQIDITFSIPADDQITHIEIYRTNGLNYLEPLPDESDLDFYYVDDVLVGTTAYSDTTVDANLGALIPDLSDGVPSGVESFAWYNDRIWAFGHGTIRYSNIESGDPHYGMWLAKNEITCPYGAPRFGHGYEDRLLIGGSSFLGTLTGYSEFDFNVRWIQGVGIVSAYAWAAYPSTEEETGWVAFVSASGVYGFDGYNTTQLSDPIDRDLYYDSGTAIAGAAVAFIPSGEIAVCVERSTLSGNDFRTWVYNLRDKSWRRYTACDARQYATYEISLGIIDVLYAWDGQPYVRRFVHEAFSVAEVTEDEITGPTTPTTSSIAWLLKSPKLTWRSQRFKTFGPLEIRTRAAEIMILYLWLDETLAENGVTLSVPADSLFGHEKYGWWTGKECQFQLSGTGDVEILGLKLRAFA